MAFCFSHTIIGYVALHREGLEKRALLIHYATVKRGDNLHGHRRHAVFYGGRVEG